MKRITIVLALLVAIALPALSYAQPYRGGYDFTGGRTITPWTVPTYEPPLNSDVNVSATRGRVLADDVDAGVDFEATNNPILACSGLDIRDSIKGMLDLDTLADDVKNYLTSLLAKQALSLVYANPAIAGVLDGLKAFGNARFQLAQTSCEAIEGEISAQSRFLRQQAFDKCMATKNNLYDCTVETGNYAEGLNEYVNSKEAEINNSIYSWLSRVNVPDPNYKAAMCAQLSENLPDACAQAQMPGLAVGEPIRDKAGNVAGVNPPVLSPRNLYDNSFKDAAGSGAVFMGTMLAVVDVFGGDIFKADEAIAIIAAKRKQAYATAMAGGPMMEDAVRDIYNRQAGQRSFIGSARQMTMQTAANLTSRYPGCTADEGTGPGHGQSTGYSYHYASGGSQALDMNCSGDEAASLDAMYRDLDSRRAELGITELLWRTDGHNDHLHVAFGAPGQGPGTYAGMAGALYDAQGIVEDLSTAILEAAAATTPAARMAKLEEALKPIPLIPEDACYYELDGKKETGLEDISDVTNIFAMNTVANQLAARKKESSGGDGEVISGALSAAAGLANSVMAQVQAFKLTGGRLSLCYTISYVERLSVMATKMMSPAEGAGFIRLLSEHTATLATVSMYDGLIHQMNQARIMANNTSAPPTMDLSMQIAIDNLKTMRDSVERRSKSKLSLTGVQNMMMEYLSDREAVGQERANSINRAGARQGVR